MIFLFIFEKKTIHFLNFSCNCLYIIIFPLSSEAEKIEFAAKSVHYKLSYKRARGPICKPGIPLKEVPKNTFLSKDGKVKYHAKPKFALPNITPPQDIPGKYINFIFMDKILFFIENWTIIIFFCIYFIENWTINFFYIFHWKLSNNNNNLIFLCRW